MNADLFFRPHLIKKYFSNSEIVNILNHQKKNNELYIFNDFVFLSHFVNFTIKQELSDDHSITTVTFTKVTHKTKTISSQPIRQNTFDLKKLN